MLLQRPDAGLGVVENRRRKRRVGCASCEDVDEVVEGTGAARRDDRNRHGAGHRGREIAVEAGLGAIAIDRGQQDFAGARRFGLARPFDSVAVDGGRPTAGATNVRTGCESRCGAAPFDHGEDGTAAPDGMHHRRLRKAAV